MSAHINKKDPETKESYFERICRLREAEDFTRVLRKWDALSRRVENFADFPMVLPDLFWVARSGVGKTNLLKLLSEYLSRCGSLMRFHGNVKYFEFMLDYCAPDAPFGEIRRMINEVNAAAGFRNLYRGIISIDIEEWLGHCEEKHFISFLEYLASNSDDWLIIFNVTGEREEEIERLESILSMYFRLEKSVLSLPDTDALLEYVSERLAEYNLVLDVSASVLISSVIDRMRENKYFDGYKTLISLCRDIAYEVYSGGEFSGRTVTGGQLSRFAPDSEYVRRATWRAERKNKIGF